VPEEVKGQRLAHLQELLGRQQEEFNRASIGRNFEVLLEKPGTKPGQMVGRSPYRQAVHVQAPQASIGAIVNVTVDGVGRHSLSAHIG
jgi:tRNA-2-methylthio-N6-dimethylallyladenosine synthase